MKSETTLNPVARGRRCMAAAGLVLGLFMAGAAHAQWTVADPAHTWLTEQGWVMQGAEIGEQAKRWKDEYEHYEQQLADAKKIFEAQSMPMTMEFNERRLDYGIEDQCKEHGASGKGPVDRAISSALSFAPKAIDKNGEIYGQQHALCGKIVFLQNSKYNELVKVLKNIQQRDKELNKLDAYRSGVGTSQGKLATSSNQINSFAARMQMDMQYAQTVIATYDGYIGATEKEIEQLATRANNGAERTVFSALMQGAVLKATFASLRAARSL